MNRGKTSLPISSEIKKIWGLDERSAVILKEIVEEFVATGTPVGSRLLSQRSSLSLSPATIRNIMSVLTDAGLLYAPHTSAGRLPTDKGLRLFVDGLLQFGELPKQEQDAISASLEARGRSLQEVMADASSMLSGLSLGAGLVMAPKNNGTLKHIEFISLGPQRALVVLVGGDGQVENRVIEIPNGVTPSALIEAGNYLNAQIAGQTLDELRESVKEQIQANQNELDHLTSKVVDSGLATWGETGWGGALFVRGQARLLSDITQMEDLTAIQNLFDQLETQEIMIKLVELVQSSEGVQIYIGTESDLFGVSGLSMIVSAARNEKNRIVGAIGVIGPTRINYGRIIPVIDYTSKIIGRLLG